MSASSTVIATPPHGFGHDGLVGINLLTKIQMPTLSALYGAMMAGMHVVLMGAGIPREIPGVLDALADHETASIKLDVIGQRSGETALLTFDPHTRFPEPSIVTSGDDVVNLSRFLEGRTEYGAADVLAYLTREVAVPV